ncbi:MAG: tRNA epoxyqueuosine(34) reductase QueG [Leptonema sp. (in: bacteria)]
MEKIQKNDYEILKNYALDLGFSLIGITKPIIKKEDYLYLKDFIENKKYANMHWFSNYKEIRLHPYSILKQCKSVLVLAYYYKDKNYDFTLKNYKIKISRYAVGKDYHKVLKKKLKKIEMFLKKLYLNIQTRTTVDSAPVPEKLLAKYSGIGWQGKNTNIINKKLGSYFFLSCIFTNLEISEDIEIQEEKDHCKGCTLCIRSCPTGALKPYQLEVEKCISYLTIESKEIIKDSYAPLLQGWIFGCDICQEVCPFNTKAKNLTTSDPNFFLREEIKEILQKKPDLEFWNHLLNSPLKRVKWEIFKANYGLLQNYTKISTE